MSISLNVARHDQGNHCWLKIERALNERFSPLGGPPALRFTLSACGEAPSRSVQSLLLIVTIITIARRSMVPYTRYMMRLDSARPLYG